MRPHSLISDITPALPEGSAEAIDVDGGAGNGGGRSSSSSASRGGGDGDDDRKVRTVRIAKYYEGRSERRWLSRNEACKELFGAMLNRHMACKSSVRGVHRCM